MKIYIAVLDLVPDHMVPVLVAHSMLGAHLQWEENLYDEYHDWLDNSFRKCVVRVNRKEFDKILATNKCYSGYENTTLDGIPSCLVVYPQKEYNNVLKFAKLWAPKILT